MLLDCKPLGVQGLGFPEPQNLNPKPSTIRFVALTVSWDCLRSSIDHVDIWLCGLGFGLTWDLGLWRKPKYKRRTSRILWDLSLSHYLNPCGMLKYRSTFRAVTYKRMGCFAKTQTRGSSQVHPSRQS